MPEPNAHAGRTPPERPEFVIGEGRLSGVLSVALGGLSLFAVLCFRYPEILTTPDLRAVYPVDALRWVLFAALLLALAASMTSVVLARNTSLGLAGLALTAAAIALGGAWVETTTPGPSARYLGLDWFVLDLLLLALLFVPLERAFALHPEQRVLRRGFKTDVAHFGASHLGIGLIVVLTTAPASLVLARAGLAPVHAVVSTLPVFVQLPAVALLVDLFQYAIHRTFHAVPALWRFHAVHHSSRELDWLAGSRLHLVDIVVTRAVSLLPVWVVGFSEQAVVLYVIFVSFHAVWIHSNMRGRLGPLRHLVVTPEFHHWHHAAEPQAVDRNFAVHFPWIDRLFGTAITPDRWPERYGIEGDPVPETWPEQLAWPFRRR